MSLESAYQTARQSLLDARCADGFWEGELSASALSTATAVSALSFFAQSKPESSELAEIKRKVDAGIGWLSTQQNDDGGWGDTDQNYSNISTTMLVVASLHAAGRAEQFDAQIERAETYIESQGSIAGLRKRYGKDKTFAVPILANCAMAGIVPWKEVASLPFEAACVPQRFYNLMQLPVVSYAIPALVAIGQAKFILDPPWNPLRKLFGKLCINRSLAVLEKIQPASGGYLEATPLTSFVVMALVKSGRADHPVVRNGIRFLLASFRTETPDETFPNIDANAQPLTSRLGDSPGSVLVRTGAIAQTAGSKTTKPVYGPSPNANADAAEQGSWPIDTNLSIWNTTLSINALANYQPDFQRDVETLGSPISWILENQNTKVHPFTGAQPGGWGWSDHSGAVPDADDTPGAMLALSKFMKSNYFEKLDNRTSTKANTLTSRLGDSPGWARSQAGAIAQTAGKNTAAENTKPPSQISKHTISAAAQRATKWLLDLQNRDKGWPTFCRGWGKLPFDRSGNDITAHAIRGLLAWDDNDPKTQTAIENGFRFLNVHQHKNGSWLPLWFGNQDQPEDANPCYGTAKVLMAYRDANRFDTKAAQIGLRWLRDHQNADGGWGGGESRRWSNPQLGWSSVEETALCTEVLLDDSDPDSQAAAQRGVQWLITAVESGCIEDSWPIGFYFAKLWYFEKLYPLIFATSALGKAMQLKTDQLTENQQKE